MTSRLTVLAGPTAVGKGTVAADVRERYPDVWLSVSATTRPPRPDEIDGVHYHFVSNEKFDDMVETSELLEWAVVHGHNRYGTPATPVLERLVAGVPVLLELDLEGARQVRERLPEAQFVFLAPPSMDELVRRSRGRGTESSEERERRMESARIEMAAQHEFDVTIVNHEVRQATDHLVSLMGLSVQPFDQEPTSAEHHA